VILPQTETSEITKLIKNLETDKACGPDKITNKMLKLASPSLSPLLSKLFNILLLNSTYPDVWKIGIVCIIYKKGEKSNPENYRPITLLSTISKLFEKLIYNSIFSHISNLNLLYKYQSGFLRGHSTADQLLSIISFIFEAFHENKDVRAIFLDIAAAFDTIPHNLLLHKIKAYGIRGNCHDLLHSYLENRKFQVRVNGELSIVSRNNFINSGVPQGSILGPLLFLIYINDLPDILQCKTFIYADDTSIYTPVDPKNPNRYNLLLQEDLNMISAWSKKWGLNFKPAKSCDIIFMKRGVRDYGALSLDGSVIERKHFHKHLGFTLDEHLNFKEHIHALSQKVQKLINPLRYLSKTMKSCHLNTIYQSFIRPHFDYCDIRYNSANKTNLSQIERIHYRAALAVSGCIQGSSTVKVLNILNWKTLSQRRDERLKIFMFKVSNGLTPNYVSDIFNKYKRNNIRNLRNTRPFNIPPNASQKYVSSPAMSLISSWNHLDKDLRDVPTFSQFKSKIRFNNNVPLLSTISFKKLNRNEFI